jgi:hypothetical protein
MGRLLRLEDLVEERLLMGMGNGDYPPTSTFGDLLSFPFEHRAIGLSTCTDRLLLPNYSTISGKAGCFK